MSKQNKQPLLQRPAVVGVLASLLSIVIGLVLGFVLLVLLNPSASVGGMKAMLTTGFSNMDKLGKVLYQAAPLMMCGLSVGFAFKTGLFNIGASGQYTMGAFFSLLCAIQFQMPWYVCLLAGAVGGAIWGVFPGLFKAYFNVNEVITAIMFNWIGMYLVNLLLANMPNMLASGWGALQLGPYRRAERCQPRVYPAQGAVCRAVRQFQLDQHFHHYHDSFCHPRLGHPAKDDFRL